MNGIRNLESGSIFKRKSQTKTDVEGMVLCGECMFAVWNQWTWYCVHPDIPHDIDYGTVDKFKYCLYFLKASDEDYTISIPCTEENLREG
jgi:hypothetical protein